MAGSAMEISRNTTKGRGDDEYIEEEWCGSGNLILKYYKRRRVRD